MQSARRIITRCRMEKMRAVEDTDHAPTCTAIFAVSRRRFTKNEGQATDEEVNRMADVPVGVVKTFFVKPSVAAIEVTEGEFQVGDVLWFRGHTTDFKQEVQSIQEERQAIGRAVRGQLVGVQVKERVREKDLVYKVVE